jgi:hypothetical protein
MPSDMTLANVSPPSLRRSDRSIKDFTFTAMTWGTATFNSRFRDLLSVGTLGRMMGGFFDSSNAGRAESDHESPNPQA